MNKPQLLILDESFVGLDERTKLKVIDRLYDPFRSWTIINITHDAELVSRSDKIYLLKDRKIVENDTLISLVNKEDSEFVKLFPFLYQQVKALKDRDNG